MRTNIQNEFICREYVPGEAHLNWKKPIINIKDSSLQPMRQRIKSFWLHGMVNLFDAISLVLLLDFAILEMKIC
jgi:hypothetical protein